MYSHSPFCRNAFYIFAVFSCFFLPLLGCKKTTRPGNVVTGKIVMGTAPVTGGQIKFVPTTGAGEYLGTIDKDGKYEVKNVAPGEMKVIVDTEILNPQRSGMPQPPKDMVPPKDIDPSEKMSKLPQAKATGVYVKIPGKYRLTRLTPLKYTVTESKEPQTKDFSLDEQD